MTLKNPSIRVDANQGASLFWGALSAIFFMLSGILLWELRISDYSNDALRDQVLNLNNQMHELASGKSRLESDLQAREQAVAAREDTVKAEENRLAQLESDPTAPYSPTPSKTPIPAPPGQNPTLDANQLTLLKKFVQAGHQFTKDSSSNLLLQSGRPVIRIPNSKLFSPGDSAISTDGKTLLGKVMTVLAAGKLDKMEMRIMLYTDKSAEVESGKPKGDPLALTASRAVAVQRYIHEETDLPLSHILCLGMGDQDSLSSREAANRRTEISLLPVTNPLTGETLSSLSSDSKTGSNLNPPLNKLEPPPDAPATTQP